MSRQNEHNPVCNEQLRDERDELSSEELIRIVGGGPRRLPVGCNCTGNPELGETAMFVMGPP